MLTRGSIAAPFLSSLQFMKAIWSGFALFISFAYALQCLLELLMPGINSTLRRKCLFLQTGLTTLTTLLSVTIADYHKAAHTPCLLLSPTTLSLFLHISAYTCRLITNLPLTICSSRHYFTNVNSPESHAWKTFKTLVQAKKMLK